MTGISPSRALLSLRLAHLKIGIHGCANCQSLLCLKSAVGIQAVYNELHCVWATGLFVQLDNQQFDKDVFSLQTYSTPTVKTSSVT